MCFALEHLADIMRLVLQSHASKNPVRFDYLSLSKLGGNFPDLAPSRIAMELRDKDCEQCWETLTSGTILSSESAMSSGTSGLAFSLMVRLADVCMTATRGQEKFYNDLLFKVSNGRRSRSIYRLFAKFLSVQEHKLHVGGGML